MALGDGLPCGFAYAKSSRTSLRAVEPDVSTPRHFMPYTACAVISSPPLQKKAPRLRCIVFEMVAGDGLFNFVQPSYSSQLANVKQLAA